MHIISLVIIYEKKAIFYNRRNFFGLSLNMALQPARRLEGKKLSTLHNRAGFCERIRGERTGQIR